MPPPQTRAEEEANRPEGDADVRSDPAKTIADELGDIDALLGQPSWDFAAGTPDDDEEDD